MLKLVKSYNYFILINYLVHLIDQGETYTCKEIELLVNDDNIFEWLARTYPFRGDLYSDKPRIDMSIFKVKKDDSGEESIPSLDYRIGINEVMQSVIKDQYQECLYKYKDTYENGLSVLLLAFTEIIKQNYIEYEGQ